MSNVWKEPIFDRTIEDVEQAIKKIEKWKDRHTHSVDARIVNDEFILRADGTTYLDNDTLILENEGAVYLEDDVLSLDIDDVYDLKGCLNFTDINRIEGNIAYLAEKMESFAYSPNIRGKVWAKSDMPTQNDMSRIVYNIRSLLDSFYSHENPPALPTTMMSYADINAIEENLYLLKQMLDCMQSSFKSSGAFKSGATTFLPLRR